MTIGEAQKLGEATLLNAEIESCRLDTSLLLEKVTGQPRSWLLTHAEEDISQKVAKEFLKLINMRSQRIPLVHLTNQREFYGLDFYIDQRVLTPRIETEQIVEWAIEFAPKNSRLIDIGTGSGAIAIAIARCRPDLEITATDITSDALEVAAKNIMIHGVKINLIKSDLLNNITGKFETFVTNLPYLKKDADLMPEVQKEPALALFGGNDGLDIYRRFLRQLPKHLSATSYLFAECDPWQQEALKAEAAKLQLLPFKENYFILGFKQKY